MTRGERNIAWIELHCRIPEGKLVGQRVSLTKEQKAWILQIYDSPTRRFILSMGRKNAKTAMSAFLLLLHLCGPEARRNSQLYSAAQSRDQAAILFSLAAKIVRMSPDLSQYVTVRDSGKQLYCAELGTLYKALSADASTAYGLSPVFAVHDELGQVRGPRSELYEAIETASAAQEAPLSIIISTQAPTDVDLLSVLIDDAKTGRDPKTKLVLYTADETLDPFSDEAIRQANPHFDVFMNQSEVRDQAQAAKRMPSAENSYRNLILNQRINVVSPFVSRTVWETCAGAVDDDVFDEAVCYLGVDLSKRNDLTAIVMVACKNGVWHVKCWFYAPLTGLYERARRDGAPYDLWQQQGWLTATPGAAVDYEIVAAKLIDLCGEYNVGGIAFDRWHIDDLKACVSRMESELPLIEFGQGFQSMSPAIDTTEAILLNGQLRHGGNPILRMCSVNAVVDLQKATGYRKLDKAKATGRIDGMIAMLMALGVAAKTIPKEEPKFQMMFV